MIASCYTELLRLQRAAVIALKPLALDSGIANATVPAFLRCHAEEVRRSLVSTRFLATQVGSVDASRRVRAHTQVAFDAVNALLAECARELDGEDAPAVAPQGSRWT